MVDLAQRKMEELEAENKRLELRVQMLERELYGSRSDKRPKDDDQQETFPSIDANTEGPDSESEKTSPSGEQLKAPARKERKGMKKGPKPLNPDLEPIYKKIARQVIASGYIMMDPTPVRLKTDQKKGSTKEAAMWTYRALDGPVFFEFATSKSGETPKETLKDYQGILHTDGASNFGGVPTQAGGGVELLGAFAALLPAICRRRRTGGQRLPGSH